MKSCPVCNTPISKKWLIFGDRCNSYKCTTCSTELEWNADSMKASYISILASILLSDILKSILEHYIGEHWFLVLTIVPVLIIVYLFTYFVLYPNRVGIKKATEQFNEEKDAVMTRIGLSTIILYFSGAIILLIAYVVSRK